MELRQLEYLVTILNEGSFTKAASRLHIAQSAVSHHVSKLERDMGVQLLRRERPKILPTPAGELFAARAVKILAEVAAARDELSSLRGHTVGEVTFGSTLPTASLDLPGILAGFRRRYPGVRVRLREGTRQELVSMVQQDTIDLAVVSIDPLQLPHGTTGVVVDHDHLVLAGPPGHPFEHYDTAPAHALDGMDLISFRKGAGLRDAADTVLREAGVVPNIVIESNEVSVLLGLIAHGLGLGIIPRGFVALAFQPIWSIPFDPPIRPPLSLIWRESRHLAPAADAFLHHIKTSTPE
ncbi:LysR family transcriptional regulator [Actinomadura welshii]|uniref:LysR family transcriptional regulator n=1 Tax=Actinomadura welshii TaxID=3103817 RepID=UPI0003AD4CB8|nr:LysR family transcriptional regulator [Actinomadura madurae]